MKTRLQRKNSPKFLFKKYIFLLLLLICNRFEPKSSLPVHRLKIINSMFCNPLWVIKMAAYMSGMVILLLLLFYSLL